MLYTCVYANSYSMLKFEFCDFCLDGLPSYSEFMLSEASVPSPVSQEEKVSYLNWYTPL